MSESRLASCTAMRHGKLRRLLAVRLRLGSDRPRGAKLGVLTVLGRGCSCGHGWQ